VTSYRTVRVRTLGLPIVAALGSGPVDLSPGRANVADGGISIDLVLEEVAGIEAVCRSGDSYAWTRKQGGIRARGAVELEGRRVAIDGRAVIDDTAGYYGPLAGTSFAAPLVAGIGAQLMSMGATNIQAANIIRATAKDLGLPGYDITYGFGRVDASAAVNLCKQVCP